MIIQGTSITVTYEKINGIKKVYYENKEILKEYFNEGTTLPIPDDAPSEIPRIIIKTLNEHAQLNISPIAATFEVNYNAGFEKDWNSCSEYISKRMEKVFEFLNILTDNKYEYIGLVTRVIYDEIDSNCTEKIVETLLNAKKINKIHDIDIKYTFVEEDSMFVNIMLQNARLFKEDSIPNCAGKLNAKNQIAESVGAIVDINDRYGFNNNVDYHSNSCMLVKLMNFMDNIINNKLINLIEKGEY